MDEKKRKEIEHNMRTDMLIHAIKNNEDFREITFTLLETFVSCEPAEVVINTDKKFDEKSEVSIHAKKRIDDIVKEYNIKFHPKLHHRTKKKDL